MPFCAAQIVYSNSWLNQTSPINSTTIFTAPSDGVFRVTVAGDISTSGGSSGSKAIESIFVSSDYSGIELDIHDGTGDHGQSHEASSGDFRLLSGGVLALNTTQSVNSGVTLIGYNVFVIVEQLQ